MTHAHCDGGAWVGGAWVPIEECGSKFLCDGIKTSEGRDLSAKCQKLKCDTCPRSRSRFTSAKVDGSYDIVIIGAGCVGSAVARELSKTKASVLLLEAADDVTQGATKGNSGIVHAGYDDKPGSVRAKFCNKGCRMFPELDKELHFGFQRNGSLVIAKTKEDSATLQRLLEQGAQNGVKNLRIIDQEELRSKEPHVSPEAHSALFAEDAGTIIPYEYCIALAENAVDNGVELRLRREVTDITHTDGSFSLTVRHWEPNKNRALEPQLTQPVPTWTPLSLAFAVSLLALLMGMLLPFFELSSLCLASVVLAGFAHYVQLQRSHAASRALPDVSSLAPHSYEPSKGTVFQGFAVTEHIRSQFIVNAAGCTSDRIAKLLGDNSFTVNPRHGDYILLHKNQGKKASCTIFPCPGPLGKGVLVQNTLWGNLILGPTARDTLTKDPSSGEFVVNKAVRDESAESVLGSILSKCKELVPSFDAREVIHTFSGARAKTTRGDWIIEACPNAPRCIHAAGIDSPGLAGSPAIALEVVRLLREAGAPVNEMDPQFNPIRKPIVMPKKGFKDARDRSIKCAKPGTMKDQSAYIVCKCEKVTESEVVEALRRSIPIDTTQAIRRRTRAGMGHCQGDPNNYCCEQRVASIIARENKIKEEDVALRPWPASSWMPQRYFSKADKDWVAGL